ncbi:MAG: hypothetical protein SF051_15080 [Elusimicrobiota bacterium]|nr:hypothetical protein [Elusimicrobiota bacterium]
MAVTLFDGSSGVVVALRPEATPAIAVEAGPRGAELAAVLRRVLAFHGLSAAVTVAPVPPAAGLWLRPGPFTGAPSAADLRAGGVAPEDWSLYLARAPYRAPLTFSRDALLAARGERAELLAVARSLAGAPAEASSRGVVGYRKRFADRLADDLDLAGALDAVWDGLKPGALSPGSRAGLLRLADPVLGLGLFSL